MGACGALFDALLEENGQRVQTLREVFSGVRYSVKTGAPWWWMPNDLPPRAASAGFPPEIISYAVWLYFRFPLSLRMVEEMLAARGICVSYETVRQWAIKIRGDVLRPDPSAGSRAWRQMASG